MSFGAGSCVAPCIIDGMNGLQDGGSNASLPSSLGNMCDTFIGPKGEQCVGFTLSAAGLACFKTGFTAGVLGNTIDVPNTDETCNYPGSFLYLRNSGKLLAAAHLAVR